MVWTRSLHSVGGNVRISVPKIAEIGAFEGKICMTAKKGPVLGKIIRENKKKGSLFSSIILYLIRRKKNM